MQESSILSPMILNVSMLSKAYVGKTVLKDVSFHLEDKEKAAIVGINGSGKTTLLRCILGIEEADEGSIAFSKEKKMDYLAQQHADIETENEDYDTLSGGQKTRKRLEEILQEKPDLLILDEPTNHLDIQGKEVLEEAIRNYEGTVLYVSHDRYFINKTATRIIELFSNRFDNYIGNYDYYIEKKEDVRAYGDSLQKDKMPLEAIDPEEAQRLEEKESKRLDWENQKELSAKRRKWQNALQKAEEKIAKLEERKEELTASMEEVGSDVGRLMEIHREQEAIDKELEEQYAIWEESSLELENLE